MKKIALFMLLFVLVLLIGCVEETLEDGEEITEKGVIIDFKTIQRRGHALEYFILPQKLVINNQTAWVEYYKKLNCRDIRCDPGIPIVNFDNETVIIALMERNLTGAHYIEIIQMTEYSDVIVVKVLREFMRGDCLSARTTSRPYHIVRTSKITKEVILEYQDQIVEC